MPAISKEFNLDKFRQTLIDYKYAHKRGRDSALDAETREFHRGSFIATAYILSLLRKNSFYKEE